MIVYRCDRCGEDIDGDVVEVLRTQLPDPPHRPDKFPESYRHFEFCENCAAKLPETKPYKVAYYDKMTGEFSHVVTGTETLTVQVVRTA